MECQWWVCIRWRKSWRSEALSPPLSLSWSYGSLPTLAYMRNQEREDFFQDLSCREEHRRKWLEWMFGHPTNSASKWKRSKFIICGSPHTAAYGYLSFLLKDLSSYKAGVSPLLKMKIPDIHVPGFLAAKVWKYPREREKLNLYPALLEASIMPCHSPKLFSYMGQYICLLFFLKIICVGFSGTWNPNYLS